MLNPITEFMLDHPRAWSAAQQVDIMRWALGAPDYSLWTYPQNDPRFISWLNIHRLVINASNP